MFAGDKSLRSTRPQSPPIPKDQEAGRFLAGWCRSEPAVVAEKVRRVLGITAKATNWRHEQLEATTEGLCRQL